MKDKMFNLMLNESDLRLLKKALCEYDYQMFLEQDKMKNSKSGYNPLNPIHRAEYDRYQAIQDHCEDICEMIKTILKEAEE